MVITSQDETVRIEQTSESNRKRLGKEAQMEIQPRIRLQGNRSAVLFLNNNGPGEIS